MTGRERGNPVASSMPAGALLALFCLACGGPARSRAAEPDGVAGRVVDASGAGVASAKVWVVGGSWEEPEAVAEATTDGQGAFSFPGLWDEQNRKGALKRITHSYGLAARDGDGRIGWLTSVYRGNKTPLKIELVETGEARGRVVDTAGKPVPGAEVVPAVFSRSHAKRSSADYVRLTPALAKPLATTTAEDGSFTLRGIPKGCESPGHGLHPGVRRPAHLVGLDQARDNRPRRPPRPHRGPARDTRRQGTPEQAFAEPPPQLARRTTTRGASSSCSTSRPSRSAATAGSGSKTCRRAATRSPPSPTRIPVTRPTRSPTWRSAPTRRSPA